MRATQNRYMGTIARLRGSSEWWRLEAATANYQDVQTPALLTPAPPLYPLSPHISPTGPHTQSPPPSNNRVCVDSRTDAVGKPTMEQLESSPPIGECDSYIEVVCLHLKSILHYLHAMGKRVYGNISETRSPYTRFVAQYCFLSP